MDGQKESQEHSNVRSKDSRTPLIQVTLPNVPEGEKDDIPIPDPHDEGLDNPAFHRGSIDITPTLTPQPGQSRNSSIFIFDPECSSLYSRQGSASVFSRRGSSNVDNPRTPNVVTRAGSTQNASEKSSLTVPTIVTKFHGSDESSDFGNELKPRGLDSVSRTFIPPPSPGMLSTNSQWSDLMRLGNSGSSRHSSFSGLSDRVSNVSSSLSEHLRYLVRAFSSRTEKVKESTIQPPSPSSLSDYENSDNVSGISGEQTHFRHRLDSFFPPEIPEDSISAIERLRDEEDNVSVKRKKISKCFKKIMLPHVLDPHSKLYLFWLFIVTLAFMYNAYAIPLRAVFPYQTNENVKYWLLCDYICDVIYILDILVFKVRISFLNSGLKEMSRKATRRNYMQKLIFKFDCASLLPLDLFYLVNMTVNPWFRLPRVLKIQTYWEFYSRCDHLVRSAHTLRIVKTMTYMLFLIHVETCGYYAVSVYEGLGTNPWVFDGNGNAYIRCFYLATKTATSIGNNPKPTNELEWIFMTVYWVSGVFVFALLIGQIRDIVDAANLVKTVYTKRMDAALQYVKTMNLPKETQDRVRTWFIYNWQQQKVIDERKLMDTLPRKLRTDLAIHVHFNTLSKVKLFQDCDKNLLYDLVLKLKPILYLPGDYVCKKGEIGKEMYIVSQGVVEVVGGPNNALVLATLREGSVFGEISLLAMAAEGNRRTADVRCRGFTNLFILSKNEFEAAMKDYPTAHKLLKKRANKLLRINARLQKKSTSSTDNSKIKADEIIKTPPETPKMVKAVMQVMDPKSSVIRHLSGRSGVDEISIPVPELGKENKAYDNSRTETHHDDQENIARTPTIQEIEDFFDEILTKTYEQEMIKKQKESDITTENPDENIPEKKTSNSSQSSGDSGVQDTKTTSPAPSTSRTISNKDSKESFMSTELGEILEDDESDDVKPTLSEDMFESPEEYKQALVDLHEDILREMGQELYFDSFDEVEDKMDSTANDDAESEMVGQQYEKSVVNGLTVTVESLDETDKRITRSLSRKRFNFAFPGHTCGDTTDPKDNIKSSVSQLDASKNLKSQYKIRSSIECEPDSVIEPSSSKTKLSKKGILNMKVKPALPPKPAHLSRNVNMKNKFGLRINIDNKDRVVSDMPHVNETERSFDSGFRSFDSGNFENNKKNIRGNVVHATKRSNNSLQYNDDSIIVEEEPSIIVEEDTSSSKTDITINEENLHPHHGFPPLIAVQAPSTETMSTDGSGVWFNKQDLQKETDADDSIEDAITNQVTCTAEVHREKTLSPPGSASEVQSPRRRKISVVSKDEIETSV